MKFLKPAAELICTFPNNYYLDIGTIIDSQWQLRLS